MDANRGFIRLVHDKENESHCGFTGLMRTCRQTRSEFRRLYVRNLKLCIYPYKLPEFSSVFLADTRQQAIHVHLIHDNGN